MILICCSLLIILAFTIVINSFYHISRKQILVIGSLLFLSVLLVQSSKVELEQEDAIVYYLLVMCFLFVVKSLMFKEHILINIFPILLSFTMYYFFVFLSKYIFYMLFFEHVQYIQSTSFIFADVCMFILIIISRKFFFSLLPLRWKEFFHYKDIYVFYRMQMIIMLVAVPIFSFLMIMLIRGLFNYSYNANITLGLVVTLGIIVGYILLRLLTVVITNDYFKRLERDKHELREKYLFELKSQSHDIKNHINTINMLLSTGHIEECKSYVAELCDETIHLNHMELHPDEIINATLYYYYYGKSLEYHIHLVIERADQFDQLPMSMFQFNKILVNLLKNAVDEAKNYPHAEISVSFEEEDEFTLTVTNTGSIDETYLETIFTDGFTTKGNGHHGVGLSFVKNIIEKYGGYIAVESSPNRVSFILYIPRKGD